MELTLDSLVALLPRVGPAIAGKLEKNLGVRTVSDLLYHIPFRYNDFSLISPIGSIRPGETVTVSGNVESMKSFYTKTGKNIQEALISDESGNIRIVWFNQSFLLRIIQAGITIRVSGEVAFFGNKIVIRNPQYEILDSLNDDQSIHTGRIVPVYHETAGITSKWIRTKIDILLPIVLPKILDPLPDTTRNTHHLLPLQEAIKLIHFPDSLEEADRAKRRLSFDELFALHLASYIKRREWEQTKPAIPLFVESNDLTKLISSLPFELTQDQVNAVAEITDDLGKTIAANRLLVGDVGNGKTIVAAIAMYIAFRNGKQSVMMAPTQILAQQHYLSLKQLFDPLGIRVDLVTSDTKTIKNNRENNQKSLFTNNQSHSIIIGTHALLPYTKSLTKLGLVVIDEQHRFGVEQRTALLTPNESGTVPHLLTMTATPIPRTMAHVVFGNIDVSILQTMPKGRKPVKTWVVPTEKRESGYEWIKSQIRKTGGQVFIICPLIEESENLTTVKAVKKEYETIQNIFSEFKVALLHGKMAAKEKTSILSDFKEKKYQVLLATPVVEVGIDVPNATIMVIEAADRFGLGQLHQLRGRVGRGELDSYCLLFSEIDDIDSITRLKALETHHSGPELAEIDLALRGPGTLLGTRQHGAGELKIASYMDVDLIAETKKAVTEITTLDPDLTTSFQHLRTMAIKGIIHQVSPD